MKSGKESVPTAVITGVFCVVAIVVGLLAWKMTRPQGVDYTGSIQPVKATAKFQNDMMNMARARGVRGVPPAPGQ